MFNYKPIAAGEPIDVTELAKMSDMINKINTALVADKSAMSSPFRPVRKQIETSELAIWTGKQLIVADSTPNVNADRVLWSATFSDITFKYPPIVTATVYCDTTDGGTIAPSAIWIHNISKTGVRGRWKWLGTTKKKETVYALITAIGEPA